MKDRLFNIFSSTITLYLASVWVISCCLYLLWLEETSREIEYNANKAAFHKSVRDLGSSAGELGSIIKEFHHLGLEIESQSKRIKALNASTDRMIRETDARNKELERMSIALDSIEASY